MTAVGKQVLRAGFIRLQQMTGFHRNKTIDFRKGTQWVSLTADCIGYLLQYKDEVERICSHTFVRMKSLCRHYAGIPLFESIYMIQKMKDMDVCE